ncbi:MAG TPA: urease accessory protein UreD [Casimicrobiaceae bacterium]|nr:urease accessory protein UreD [Casimicrobiaceae bacterium]
MPFDPPGAARGWSARLELAFASRGPATVLARRAHRGPLVVQKALYPEGPRVCHAILVHPPSGMAGGDTVEVDLSLGPGAHALVTTPGASKWYRSAGALASQRVTASVEAGATLEWLPQEAIVYDAARADLRTMIALAPTATFVGMDVVCFGRTASGERFLNGSCGFGTRIERDGAPVWIERGEVDGGSALLDSPVGLDGQPVVATLVAASTRAGSELLGACRGVACGAGRGAVTLLPGLIVARWLGPACEPARTWLAGLWGVLRPALAGVPAATPRIWTT